MVDNPLLAEPATLELFRSDIVEGQRQLLILVILVEVVVAQVTALLGGYHLLHHFHSGVVLTAVPSALGLDCHFLQHIVVGLQLHEIVALHVAVHHRGMRHIANGTECQRPSVMTGNPVVAVDVGGHTDVVSLVLHAGERNGLTRLGIGHRARDHLLGGGG